MKDRLGKKLVKVEVSLEVILHLAIEQDKRWFKCMEGLPEDSELFDAEFNYFNSTITIYVSHPSFGIIEDANNIPYHKVIVRGFTKDELQFNE